MAKGSFDMSGSEIEVAAKTATDARLLRRYALLLLHGHRGLAEDVARGLAVLEDAAKRGDPAAAIRLGDAHSRGHFGLADDADAGMRFYRHAAELGDPAAQANVAASLYQANPAEAAMWFEKAAAQGQPYARTMLAKMRGGEVPPPVAETFAAFAATPLVDLAQKVAAKDGTREVDLEVTGAAAALMKSVRGFIALLDERWPRLDVLVEADSTALDFPGSPLPAAVVSELTTVEIRIRPNGDTRYALELSADDEDGKAWSLAFNSSAPHPQNDEWGWIVAGLETSLRAGGMSITAD